MPEKQSFKNHARFDPKFHFVAVPIALINVIVMIVYAFRHPSGMAIWAVVVSIGFALSVFIIRLYALQNQDRLIRLEERIRIQKVLEEPLRSWALNDLLDDQYIAIRFASDGELAVVVEKALRGRLTRKAIKAEIQTWRADEARI